MNEFIMPEFRTSVQGVLDRALEGEESANFEFPLITKSNRRVEVLLNATTRRDERGNIMGVVGIGQDITQFLMQQQEYTRLIENANAPICKFVFYYFLFFSVHIFVSSISYTIFCTVLPPYIIPGISNTLRISEPLLT